MNGGADWLDGHMPASRSAALIEALRRADAEGVSALLAESVSFNSPVATYTNRADIAHLLAIIGGLVDELEPEAEFRDGPQTVTLMRVAIAEHWLDGALIQTVDPEGRLVELTLM